MKRRLMGMVALILGLTAFTGCGNPLKDERVAVETTTVTQQATTTPVSQPAPAITSVPSVPGTVQANQKQDRDVKAGESSSLSAGWICKGDLQNYFVQGNVNGTRGNVVLVTGTVTLYAPFGANCSVNDRTPNSFVDELFTKGCKNGAGCQSVAMWCAPKGTQSTVANLKAEIDSAVSKAIADCGWPSGSRTQGVSTPMSQLQPVGQTSGDNCPEAVPGGPRPYWILMKDGSTACGGERQFTGAPAGSDVPLRNREQKSTPAGYFCDGDIKIGDKQFYSGASIGEKTVVLVATSGNQTVFAPFGADCMPGSSSDMKNRCLSEFDSQPVKDRCAFFYQ